MPARRLNHANSEMAIGNRCELDGDSVTAGFELEIRHFSLARVPHMKGEVKY